MRFGVRLLQEGWCKVTPGRVVYGNSMSFGKRLP